MYDNEEKARITHKIILKGNIKTLSPLLIGTGDKSDFIDALVQRDYEGKPFIPATSFLGVLRHHFVEYYSSRIDEYILREFFGFSEKINGKHEGVQSAVALSDLNIVDDEYQTEIRDGVRIDNTTGTAKEGGKYDYEILPAGKFFNLKMELTIRLENSVEDFMAILKTLMRDLNEEEIRIGAMGAKGFGKILLQDAKVFLFDFKNQMDVIAWLENDFENGKEIEDLKSIEAIENGEKVKDFILDAHFSLKTSLIVRAYSGEPEAPDASSIISGGEKIIPGTSLKGALRARAERILNTLGISEEFGQNLMGFVADEQKSDVKIKSRMIVDEHVIDEKNIFSLVQSRIRIDRFTGGTIKTALFDLAPVWPKEGKEILHLKIKIKKCREEEAGLLLLVIKDLWNGDIALGGEKNVGRGVLEGKSLNMVYGGNSWSVFQEDGGLKIDGDKEEMESWIQKLVQRGGERNAC